MDEIPVMLTRVQLGVVLEALTPLANETAGIGMSSNTPTLKAIDARELIDKLRAAA